MKPWQQAKKWQLENSKIDFEELLGAYLNGGYVWSSPTEFMLFTKVCVVGKKLAEGEPNAWYIQLAGGENPIARLVEILPEPMEMICWHRGLGRLHVWAWEKFNRFRKER